jgi:hypothetical protein
MVGAILAAAPAAEAFTVSITGHPDDPTLLRDSTFAFSADAAARYQCAIDGAALAPCSSPTTYFGLPVGSHSFTVKATSIGGTTAVSDTKTFAWQIVVPDTTIVDHPKPATLATDASFTFASAPSGATFECDVDGGGFSACASPFAIGGLSPGVHTLAARAVGPSGTDPTPASFQWGVLGGPLRPGFVQTKRPKLHGGYRFTRKMLLRKTRFPKVKRPHEDDDELITPVLALCGIGTDCIASLRYGRPPIAHSAGLPRTAGPPKPTWSVSGNGNDPQIAVGKSFVVVTSYNQVWFYTKAGKPLNFNDHGQSIANPIPATTLFSDLWNTKSPNYTPVAQSINSFLNLPSWSKCDPTDPFPPSGYGLNDKSAFCLNDFYDMRAIYDEFRDRFWIIAIARNPKWKDLNGTPGNHISRRTKTLLAVSKTGDPRDGFYLYWWNSVIDDGACHSLSKSASGDTKVCGPANTYQPGDAADYPSIGISKDYFIQTIAGQHFNPFATPDFTKDGKSQKYAVIHVFQANKLANGGCNSPCSWSYWNFKYPNTDFTVTGTLQAVVEHETDPFGFTWLTQDDGNERVYVWGFSHAEKAFNPPLHSGWSNVSKINGAIHDPAIPGGGTLSYSNLGSGMLKAVERNGELTATFMDCIATGNGCRTAARVVEISPFLSLFVPPIALVCGGCTIPVDSEEWIPLNNALDDAAGSYHEAGQPAGDVSKSGNVVVGYIRCCTGTGPEARYAARLPGDANFRPDNVFKAPSGAGANGFNGDTGGASADPVDPDGVWLANLYGTGGSMGLQVGKVLGKPFPDFAIEGVDVSGNLAGGGSLSVATTLVNYGDGNAPTSTLRLRLVCSGGNGNPKTAGVRALSAGSSRTVTSTLSLPASIPKRPCHVAATADSALTVKEYDEDNNTESSANLLTQIGRGGNVVKRLR